MVSLIGLIIRLELHDKVCMNQQILFQKGCFQFCMTLQSCSKVQISIARRQWPAYILHSSYHDISIAVFSGATPDGMKRVGGKFMLIRDEGKHIDELSMS